MATERAAERALRALGPSGRRLVARADGWGVTSGGDRRRRPVARLSDAEARDLISAGAVVRAEGGGFVLANAHVARAVQAPRVSAFVAVGHPRGRTGGVGFAGLALRAERGEGPLSARGAAAGLRLVQDAESAARRPGLTMDWDAAPADARRRGPGGGPSSVAMAAERRLGALRKRLGAAFDLAWAACVEGAAMRVLERRFGLERRCGGERLGEALEALAAAYDAGG